MTTLFDSVMRSIMGRDFGLDRQNNLLMTGKKIILSYDNSPSAVYGVPDFTSGADNTALFQAALTAAAAVSGEVKVAVPITLSSSVTIPENVTLSSGSAAGQITLGAGVTLTINGPLVCGFWQFFDATAAGALVTGSPQIASCCTEWFGAVGGGIVDCTIPFQKTAKFALDAGCIAIDWLATKYLLTASVYASGSNSQLNFSPRWRGQGHDHTILSYPNIAYGSPALIFRGGSGHNPMLDVVTGAGFEGNATSTGIQFDGTNNMRAVNCRFETNAIGIDFGNVDAGSFTEFCFGDNCLFRCTNPIRYRRIAGNDSHHGAGLLNQCLVQIASQTITCSGGFAGTETSGTLTTPWAGLTGPRTGNFSSGEVRDATLTNGQTTLTWSAALTQAATASVVLSGDVVVNDANGKPYEAALDAIVFPSGTSPIINIFNNRRSTAPSSMDFIGFLRVENISTAAVTLGINNAIDFLGPISVTGVANVTGAGVVNGTLRRVKTRSTYQNSSVLVTGYESSQVIAIAPGANTITSHNPASHRLYYLRFTGTTYDQRFVLSVDHDGGGGAGYATIVATIRQLDTPAYGAPVFSVNTSGQLIATQAGWPSSGITCYAYESQLSGNAAGGNAMLF